MENPKVSVIIPAYNEEKVISNLLKSIKNQTYKQIEIIVVDDKSRDRTAIIAQEYTPLVFRQKIHQERSKQRNYGAGKAIGKYVLFLDSDMILESKVVEECVKETGNDPVIKAVIIPEKTTGKGYWSKCKALERDCYIGDETIEAARFFEKKTFFKFGGYDENISGPEDWDLPQRIKKQYRIGRINSFIIHNEEEISLVKLLKKKYYYAQSFANYAKKQPSRATCQALLIFRPSLYKNWRILVQQPAVALGMFFMLVGEMMAGGFGYLVSLTRTNLGKTVL
jgi:glycosyltransferase involved in cell wall biosynthesis